MSKSKKIKVHTPSELSTVLPSDEPVYVLEKQEGIERFVLGKKVLVRSMHAGVHFGVLRAKEGADVVLDQARRVWSWEGAYTCSELASKGFDIARSKVAVPIDGHWIGGCVEILPCSEAAIACFEAATWAK